MYHPWKFEVILKKTFAVTCISVGTTQAPRLRNFILFIRIKKLLCKVPWHVLKLGLLPQNFSRMFFQHLCILSEILSSIHQEIPSYLFFHRATGLGSQNIRLLLPVFPWWSKRKMVRMYSLLLIWKPRWSCLRFNAFVFQNIYLVFSGNLCNTEIVKIALRNFLQIGLWVKTLQCVLLSFEQVLLSAASPPRYWGRCWAAIWLSHRPEPSGYVVRGGSMDWTVEDDMVDGLFCTTLTGRRGGHTLFVQAGAETSDTSAEAVEPDPGSSWESHSRGVCTGVWN